MGEIILRPVRYTELPRIATVFRAAFWDDGMFGDFIHPHRNAYPGDMDLWWLRRARVNFWDYAWQWMVAVERDENGEETVAGIAQWIRKGEGGKKLQCAWYDPRNLLKPMSTAAMKVHAIIWPNRACDPAKEDVLQRADVFIEQAWTGPRSESWYLDFLAVHPNYQGKGIGRKLVLWGLERAEQEGICASVISAWGKDAFYQKCGFNIQDGRAGAGEGNPLADVSGGNMWWKMP